MRVDCNSRVYRSWPLAGLAALLIFCSVISFEVVRRDTVPLMADAAWYYRISLQWYRDINNGEPGRVFSKLFKNRPPLPQLVTTGLFLLTDAPSQRMARHSILLFLWILLISTYRIGAMLRGPPTGLIAAALLACFPHIIGYSRAYWMDLPLTAMTSLCVWSLLATDHFRRRLPSVMFGLCLGLGMMTKQTFPVFLIGPVVYVLVSSWRSASGGQHRKRDRRLFIENLSLALFTGMVVCGFWYVVALTKVWNNFIHNQGSGALHSRACWTLKNLFNYVGRLANIQLGTHFAVLLVICLPLFWRRARPVTRWVVLSWIIIPYLFFTFVVLGMEWARFTMPYLPAVALIMAIGMLRFQRHLPVRICAGVICVLALWSYVSTSFEAPKKLMPGKFAWAHRMERNGILSPRPYSFHIEASRVFPGQKRLGVTRVAVLPDVYCLASVFATWAFEQGTPVHFYQPYKARGPTFGGQFRHPERTSNPRYLMMFHYVMRVIYPLSARRRRRPTKKHLRRFEQLWKNNRHRFELGRRLRLPNEFELLIYQNRRYF